MRPAPAAPRGRRVAPSGERASRRRGRGGAAVEVCLSITFLMISIVVMLDVTRLSSALARNHGPARLAAWQHARLQDDKLLPDWKGSVADVAYNVYQAADEGPTATGVETGDDAADTGSWQWAPEGVIGHILGKITATKAIESRSVDGLIAFPRETVYSRTVVFLKSDREQPWDGRKGWFDAMMWVKDLILNLFKDPKNLVPSADEIPGLILEMLGSPFGPDDFSPPKDDDTDGADVSGVKEESK